MSTSVKWHRFLCAAVVAWLTAIVLAVPAACQNPPNAAAAKAPPAVSPGAEAPLMFWNRTIFVFRSSFEQLSPDHRAAGAKTRIEALPEFGPWAIDAKPATVGTISGILISVNQRPMFGVLPGDLDPEAGETLEQAASQAVARLKTALEARESQQNVPLMLRAVGFAAAATFLFVGAVWLTIRLQKKLTLQLQKIVDKSQRLKIGGVDVRSHVASFERVVIRFLTLAAVVFLTYVWLMYQLMRFPYTQPWGDRLGTFLLDLFQTVVHGIVKALPDLFTVVVILVLTRVVARARQRLLSRSGRGKDRHPWVPARDGARHPPPIRFCHLDFFPDCCIPLHSRFQHRRVQGDRSPRRFGSFAGFSRPRQPGDERAGNRLLASLQGQ